ncbi:glutathione S-transferase [uncultured Pseudoteredinibacter sp.]|uniref:glutathione S-transferase family protein n=1 Tax=uncultured Pseudoteredinibacter sp. TaxID=1641701 RepID=UPI002627F19D|nr:glutathione S-transferase [uncultured Pseudoteredinibacter sp.]
MSTIKLYRHPLSGHSHRVELFLSLLNLDAEIIDVDLLKGEHKSPEFLAKNPAGQVPVLEDGDVILHDSNAILVYLAATYDKNHSYYPHDPVAAAEIQRYLSAAAGPIASGPATARLITVFSAALDADKAIATAHAILARFEADLNGKNWLVGEEISLADIANYAYIAHAPEGNVNLADYPNVQAWLKRIEALDNFVAMTSTPIGLAA